MPDDTFVSQLHARVFRRDGAVFIDDLGSTNGTFLNGRKLTTAEPVAKGDRLQIGNTIFEAQ
jgi:pSer/pThr/pTyr-binding forkhead associated (FHA) protein